MSTWHQDQHPVKLYHPTQWTVCIDPPNQMRALMTFTTRDLAEIYMRNLAANNPGAYRYSFILKPAKEVKL